MIEPITTLRGRWGVMLWIFIYLVCAVVRRRYSFMKIHAKTRKKIQADIQNLGACSKLRRMSKIWAEKLCGIVKVMRHIIYARTKADVEISASDENFCAYQKIRHPSCAPAYYLGSAESPTADFLQVWLKSSRSSKVASRACRPQVIWRLRPFSFYGRRLSRTVPAVVPARLVKISADCQT